MNRKETTEFLSNLLIRDRLTGMGKYYAKEVVLDYGHQHPKRIDYLQYIPKGVYYVGDIEQGTFIVYEIKSCKEDVYSGNGLNFIGDENYIVTTIDCYKSLLPDIQSGKLRDHIREVNGRQTVGFSFLLAVPDRSGCERFNPQKAVIEEIDNPTSLTEDCRWRLAKMGTTWKRSYRNRSVTELLFCMVRAGR